MQTGNFNKIKKTKQHFRFLQETTTIIAIIEF